MTREPTTEEASGGFEGASETSAAPSIFDANVAACPHAAYQSLLRDHPVARMPLTNSPIISRYEDVVYALRHPEIFSSDMAEQMALGTKRPMIPQQIDPPAQTKYRKILDPQFSRKRMLQIEPRVRQGASELIDAFVDDGECELDRQYAIPLPCNAFLNLMGLPLEELDLFLELKNGVIRPNTLTDDMEKMVEIRTKTGERIYAYFEDLIEERRRKPQDDLMGHILDAEIDGDKLTDEEILDVCYLLLIAGLDTVTASIGCFIAHLAANEDRRRMIVSNPGCIDTALEELLRWETPVTGVPRLVKQDCEIAGTKIREGELVMLLLGASNLDPAEFDEADRVELERERNRHIAFGAGPHRCLGSHLARMELRVALEEWHRRIPEYRIKPGETPTYSPGIREVQYLPLVWS